MADEVPYQQANQIRQLLNERENAEAYGQEDRVKAVDKQLAELGYKTEKQAAKAAAAAEERATETAPSEEPKGRTTRAQQTTTEGGTKTSAKK